METDFQACVMAAAQVASAVASVDYSPASEHVDRILNAFKQALDAAIERIPDYDGDDDEDE
jgi:hypothetical protein